MMILSQYHIFKLDTINIYSVVMCGCFIVGEDIEVSDLILHASKKRLSFKALTGFPDEYFGGLLN
jgi:hypothetical protein